MAVILINILTWTLAILAPAFVFWRRMKNELDEDTFWPSLFKIIIWTMAIGRIIWWAWQITLPEWHFNWLWEISAHPGFDILGGLIGIIFSIYFLADIKRPISSELGDALIEAYGWALIVFFTGQTIISFQQYWPLASYLMISLIIFYTTKSKYRSWSWYISGKVGLLWWTGIVLISLGQLLIFNLASTGNLIYIITRNTYFSIPLLTGIMGAYKLSGRDWREDYRSTSKAIRIKLTVLRQKLRRSRK